MADVALPLPAGGDDEALAGRDVPSGHFRQFVMNLLTSLPDELQWEVWRHYLRAHVLPSVRPCALEWWVRKSAIFVSQADFERGEMVPHVEGVWHAELAALPEVRWYWCPLTMQPYHFHVRHATHGALLGSLAFRRVYHGLEIDTGLDWAARQLADLSVYCESGGWTAP